MKPISLLACLWLAAPASPAVAQNHHSGSEAQPAGEPVNAMCPVSKEPIARSAGTVEHKGTSIGLCCPGCDKQFMAWEEARKDEFVALAVAQREPGRVRGENAEPAGGPTEQGVARPWTDPYPLDACPISGQKLGSMGDPIVKKYDGREVRFCCAGCIEEFEADLEASWKRVDEAIVRDQLGSYPLDTCVVTGEPLVENGEDIAANMVYGNRLVRLCCAMCERELKADPRKFIARLDNATADAQREGYPLDTCIVAGGELGSMGEPAEMVIAGRLMRFCCAGCEPKVRADPARYIAAIDEAWQAKGRRTPTEDDARFGERDEAR